ncbi:polyprenyl synthetase family protein [Flaviaesturariibacter flavus]|uniref:Polyprenyl synthetase family protein n=1 Tax=Flaviaesturariibacter flavus TaxID=2502780 RepID=A0A4R1B9I0_9BACT|nr:polyprenyl synthetase family protein [Flaviaesturariibacter flavus]TCJ13570.1 polyprenyl synthetase family protein [Flaviaesturariibacter flavus]
MNVAIDLEEPKLTTGPLDAARDLVGADLERFEKELLKTLRTQRRYLSANTMEIYRRGKRFRPMLLLLSARLNGASPVGKPLPPKVITAAVSLEMLHVGSLLHDDIVDRAPLRRGLPSLNAESGNEVAMLVGDMQMIESMRRFVSSVKTQEDLRLVSHYLDTALDLCKGEIDELRQRGGWNTDFLRRRYLRTIDRKTSRLIALSCEAGARLVEARVGKVAAMEKYGLYCGRAFQVMDDLKDIFQDAGSSGKERFIDLRNRRITLPYIYVLEGLPPRNPVRQILSGRPYTEKVFAAATSLVPASPGIDKAYSEARVYMLKACEELEIYGDNPYARCLRDLARAVVDG